MKNKLLKILVRSFEGTLSAAEEKELHSAAQSAEELFRAKETLARIRTSLQNAPQSSFGPFFAERVVQRIKAMERDREAQGVFFDFLAHAFRRVVVIGAAASLLLFSYNLLTSDTFSISEAFGIRNVTIAEAFDPLMYLIEE